MSVYFQIEEYHRPQNLTQAVDILSRSGDSARVIAGGTDILPLRPGVKKIDPVNDLVDISKLGLDYLKKDGDHICIGAATTIKTIGTSPLFLSRPYKALSEAADAHSTATIRNRATVGGNLCTASACGDLAFHCWYWMLSWWQPDLMAKDISRSKAFLKVPIIRP